MAMVPSTTYARTIAGLLVIALVYLGPELAGRLTADGRLDECLSDVSSPQDVVVQLDVIPDPTQIEALQQYGIYGGSGGDVQAVVLERVPPRNVALLGNLHWVAHVRPVDGC